MRLTCRYEVHSLEGKNEGKLIRPISPLPHNHWTSK
jgi:hypothetical protein